ncbi:MAG: SMR family transporter, partial [Candidatus Heimdallarchaeota archaeon]
MASTVLAIIFGIISYSLVNIGLALQKKGATSLPKIEKTSFWLNLKNFFSNKFWLIGILCTNVSFVFLAIAMNQGPLSIVAPMQGVGLTVLLAFSFFYLKEKISIWEVFGIITIIAGIVILGVTNSPIETVYTIDEINQLFLQTKSIVFLCVFTALVFTLVIFSILRKYRFASIIFGLGAGTLSGLGAIFTKAYMSAIDFSNFSTTIINAFTKLIWWLFFFIMVVYNFLSEVFPQIAYQKGKVVLVAPLFAV